MTRKVHCVVDNIDTDGLDFQPWPGAAGKHVFEHVGKPAWQRWLAHQTMLINENRLSMLDPRARQYLLKQCEAFFFGDGGDAAVGFVPPSA